MAKYASLDNLKYFKTKQDAANAEKYVPQGITINGVALNKTAVTVTDDTKLSKSDAETLYAKSASLAAVATSGKYSDLTGAPDSLKSPAAITFTGGATGSYDGSKAVEIAVPAIPSDVSAFTNDAGYLTEHQDISNLATKDEVSAIPKFAVAVVDALPTENISGTTVYLVKTGDASQNLYTEYLYVNSAWEQLGTQALDLTGYTKDADLAAVAKSGKYSDLTGTPTYSVMTGATSEAAGKEGFVPAPAAGQQGVFLRGDGTWASPANTEYSVATQSANGLMSSDDKTKLDSLEAPEALSETDIDTLFTTTQA